MLAAPHAEIVPTHAPMMLVNIGSMRNVLHCLKASKGKTIITLSLSLFMSQENISDLTTDVMFAAYLFYPTIGYIIVNSADISSTSSVPS